MKRHKFDSREDTSAPKVKRADSPVSSCVSMKSEQSITEPVSFSSGGMSESCHPENQREPSPVPSCVSMKSDHSIIEPFSFSGQERTLDSWTDIQRAASPGPSCVSMNSVQSITEPITFSSQERTSNTRTDIQRAASPGPSCVSMNSVRSITEPVNFSCQERTSNTRTGTQRAGSSVPSCMSMRSYQSITEPVSFSSGERREAPPQNQSWCAVCKQLPTVSIYCKHRFCRQCIFRLWDQCTPSGDFLCPQCQKTSRTHHLLEPHQAIKQSMQQKHTENDILKEVLERHKTNMRKKFESLYEGLQPQENKTLLNSVYTQLYILEGECGGVNEEHEVFQPGKTLRTQHSQDKPMDYNSYKSLLEDVKIQEHKAFLERISDQLDIEGETEGVNENEVLQIEKSTRKQDLKENPISCNDIFERSHKQGMVRTVLTKGIAGIGKTVSVQKFIVDWADLKTNQDVDFMFVLPFRELNLIKDEQYSFYRLLCDFHPELKDLDLKIFDKCKFVFIFDGLDESRISLNFLEFDKISDMSMTSSVGVLMTNLIVGELLPSAHIWITSRPAAANQIPFQYINRVTEIQGFNDPQKEEYFKKRISNQDLAQKIITHIKAARSLHIMCHIPVFCWISATVLQQIMQQDTETKVPKTLTEMYAHFLLNQANIKNKKYEEMEERDPKKLLQANRRIILKLAELAFRHLIKGNMMFYEDDLKECGINITEASMYSGICTEIFKEESVLYQRKVYCFVHLSFQEFLAAFYVFHCYEIKNMEVLQLFQPPYTDWSENILLEELLKGAVGKAIKTRNGQLDLFLRFLLGISQESNQSLLQGLLTRTQSSSESLGKITRYIQKQIKGEDEMEMEVSVMIKILEMMMEKVKQRNSLPTDRSINLFLCLTEMNDQSLSSEIQEYLKSEKHSEKKLTPGQCLALACMLLTSEEVLDVLEFKQYNASDEGYRRLIPAVSNCKKAILAGCNLSSTSCDALSSALQTANCPLKELDISNNSLQDSGVELLSTGLQSSNCKLEILRVAGCSLTTKSSETFCSILKSTNSYLKELDISKNNLQDSGVELLSDGLMSLQCKLQILRLSGCNLTNNSCKTLCCALKTANYTLTELDLSFNNLQTEGVKLLSAGLESSHFTLEILRLAGCSLSVNSCESLCSALKSASPPLKSLDLSNNDLQDSGVELLSDGLKSSQCELEILRLSRCMITEEGCSCLASALSSNPSHLRQLDLTYNLPGDSGVKLLSARLEDPHSKLETLKLAVCNLSIKSCQSLASALQSENSTLRELDLSTNDLQDSGVKLLSDGLKSSNCKLQILRLSGCMITEEGCSSLASALSLNPSHLREIDLTYNHPGDSGVELLSARLEDPYCNLKTLLEHSGMARISPGLKKYICELTLDPNTVHTDLALSEGCKRVTSVRESQPYPDHPERFDVWLQVLCRESLSGRCYWEVEWNGGAAIAVTYKGISRKGGGSDCRFGYNEKSWRLYCSKNAYNVWHNSKITDVCAPTISFNRVGVYLDWPAGILSFYSVSSDTHTLTHLHTFHSTFTEPLYAGFWVGFDSSVCVCV